PEWPSTRSRAPGSGRSNASSSCACAEKDSAACSRLPHRVARASTPGSARSSLGSELSRETRHALARCAADRRGEAVCVRGREADERRARLDAVLLVELRERELVTLGLGR